MPSIQAAIPTAYRHALLAATLALSSGCASVRVEGGAEVKTGLVFAPLIVRPDGSSPVTIIRAEGIGWVPHGAGVTLGYHKEIRVLVSDPTSCQLIVLEPASDPAGYQQLVETLKNSLGSATSICTIPRGSP